MKKSIILLIIVMSTVLILGGCSSKGEVLPTPEKENEISKNIEFPYFTTEDFYGNVWTQEIFKQYSLTMVNIWGTYCGPCIDEMPDLARLYKELDEMDVNLIGIPVDVSQDTNKDLALQITEESGVEYTNLFIEENIMNYLNQNISAIPTTVFVNSEGNIIGMPIIGALTAEEYKKIIKERLLVVN